MAEKPPAPDQTNNGDLSLPVVTLPEILGWGVLYLILIAGADVPTTGGLAASFAWLLLVGVLVAYGAAAFNGLTSILNPSAIVGG